MAEITKAYEPKEVEAKWTRIWQEHQPFVANPSSNKPPYSIVMPPPNVTGVLHMGHAINNTLQDILIRFKRMQGFETLWIPGTDHAGISTQSVVERNLMTQHGKRRSDFSRKEFVDICWQWKEKSQGQIINQLKRLGISCDWSRERFTMDETCNKAVYTAFKKLYDQGLIYRGDYLVNWDPITETALADDEVEYEEKTSFLWHFAYPIEHSGEHIVVATTRPETLLGDTAVAVNPKDSRYHHLIGKHAILPLVGRKIPIIADEDVDPTFGTGCVKITPAHDFNDYAMWQRHNIEIINIMNQKGIVNENGGRFAGLSMSACREAVVQAMTTEGRLIKKEPYTTRVGVSYRSKAIIEPHLSKQWFVKLSAFKDDLRQAVESGTVQIIPENWKSTYFHWIDNLRDWCISRQLWWGHRIPIWYNKKEPKNIVCGDGLSPPSQVTQNPDDWEQDPDVLDTWFSSGLWPFSTMGYPEETPEFKKFYPTSILMTGYDILFFWVARMIMMSKALLNTRPFDTVFLNGIIYGKSYWRTSKELGIMYVPIEEKKRYDLGETTPADVEWKWEKMSKSKGNVLDPLDIIEEFGTDAMRMALSSCAAQSAQIDLDRRKFEEYKNFANKIWNASRFVFMHTETLSKEELQRGIDLGALELEDKWILSRLSFAVEAVAKHINAYEFDKAMECAYNFFWNEFCAYYLEMAKGALTNTEQPLKRHQKQKILLVILLQAIRLLHPIAPFITEELFAAIKEKLAHGTQNGIDSLTKEAFEAASYSLCSLTPYPAASLSFEKECGEFEFVMKLIWAIRNLRAELRLAPNIPTEVVFSSENKQTLTTIQEISHLLQSIIKISKCHFGDTDAKGISLSVDGITILIPKAKEDTEKERTRLEKEKATLQESIQKQEEKLKLPQFIEKAPPQLIEKHKENLEKLKRTLEEITKRLGEL